MICFFKKAIRIQTLSHDDDDVDDILKYMHSYNIIINAISRPSRPHFQLNLNNTEDAHEINNINVWSRSFVGYIYIMPIYIAY